MKIGLLLGLVFIFLVAFVINGLNFKQDAHGNELMFEYANGQSNLSGMGQSMRQLANDVHPYPRDHESVFPRREDPAVSCVQDIRTRMPLPMSQDMNLQTQARSVLSEVLSEQSDKRESDVHAKDNPLTLSGFKTVWPKTYVVQSDDNLAKIAQKMYGSELGNTHACIEHLYQANRDILKSPDLVVVGQKLVIPIPKIPEGASLASDSKNHKTQEPSVENRPMGRTTREYIVREGDSLWKIAARQLGDGQRYSDIVRLNSGSLSDENTVKVGMTLLLPVR